MAARNTKTATDDNERSLTSVALELRDPVKLDRWLDDHLVAREIKTKAGPVQREMRRVLTVSAPVQSDLYIAIVTDIADTVPGAIADNDLVKGVMARAVRAPLMVKYQGMTYEAAAAYEEAREKEQSEARAKLMSALASGRSIVTKEDASMLEKLKARMAEDPEFAAMFADFAS